MSARLSVSSTSVDLPEPETPVTTVNAPTGKCAVMFLRLCSRQPEMVRKRGSWFVARGLPARRSLGEGGWFVSTETCFRPVR